MFISYFRHIKIRKPLRNLNTFESERENIYLFLMKSIVYFHVDGAHPLDKSLHEAHDVYVEQLLIDTKTCLLNYVYLYINDKILEKIIQDFKRDETRINC